MNRKQFLCAALLVFLQTASVFATADTIRVIRSGNLVKTASPIVTDLAVEGKLVQKSTTLADGATSLDASLGNIFVTQANTGETVLSSISKPTVGQTITIIGGSSTNATTLADSGNFKLSTAMTFNADDSLTLVIVGETTFVEVARTDN